MFNRMSALYFSDLLWENSDWLKKLSSFVFNLVHIDLSPIYFDLPQN